MRCSQRWLRALRLPAGRLDAELLGVLGVQALPAFERHGIGADDAPDGLAVEGAIQHVEADVPAGGAHGDEPTIDVVPEREARAVADRLQLPPEVLAAPVELEQPGGVGAPHLGLGDVWRWRTDGGQPCGARAAEVAVRIERSPFAEVLGIGERLPDSFRWMAKVADQDEGPAVSVLLDVSAKGGAGRVLLTATHVTSCLSWMRPSPSDPGVAPGHRRASTRSGGTARAMRRPPGAAWE